MFPAQKEGEWEPYKIREHKPKVESNGTVAAINGTSGGDVAMGGVDGEEKPQLGDSQVKKTDEEILYEEDPNTDEGAVYPLKHGRVTDWSCFFALLTHIHNTLSPPFHTPILLISQPSWTSQDHEMVTQFIFEKIKPPAFCLMDSALATCYAYGVGSATVVDVGFEKTDVTAISDFVARDVGRGVAVEGVGGDAMTDRLLELLGPKGWSRDMCEQLKRSHICEVLPRGTPLPGTFTPDQTLGNPAAAASTGALKSGQRGRPSNAAKAAAAAAAAAEEKGEDGEKSVEADGVLDVASLVASGKTAEYLAKKEKEKAEKAAKKVADGVEAAAEKQRRLPNSKKEKNSFWFEERRAHGEPVEGEEKEVNENGKRPTDVDVEMEIPSSPKRQKTPEPAAPPETAPSEPLDASTVVPEAAPVPTDVVAEATAPVENVPVTSTEEALSAYTAPPSAPPAPVKKEEKRKTRQAWSDNPDLVRRELEVGTERFEAATGGILEGIADAVYRTILAVEETNKRGELWDGIIVVGNGSKIRGKPTSSFNLAL
jgi:actin-related protein 9